MRCHSLTETSARSPGHTPRDSSHPARLAAHCALAAALTPGTRSLTAQQPTSPPPVPTPAPAPVPPTPVVPAAPAAAIVAYRAPVLALVQPPPGALTVPQDRPVVVFRFAQGEAADPIDGASFRVTVDGRDRTALFQVSAAEAWGPLGEAGADAPLAAGAHQVAARVCSSRGACGEAAVTVTAVAPTTAAKDDKTAQASRKARVFDLVLSAARRLLAP